MSDRTIPSTQAILVGALAAGPIVAAFVLPAWAGPEGQQVVAGSATFARNGAVTTITAANKTIINYTGFNIAGHETVRFIQPDASSRVLNRISGASPTSIDGTLLSNGIVYIVNPAGVVFGNGAVINVGGLHAAAASIADTDFLSGTERFTDARGSVVNNGTIISPEVVLFGRAVQNTGSVISPNGVVAFVAGEDLYLGERGGRMYIRFDGAASPGGGGVSNLGNVAAPGGRVMVGAGDMFGVMLHGSSRIAAKEVSVRGGRGAVTSVSGTIDASSAAPGSAGGSVDIRGDHVGLFGATIDASGAAGGGSIRVGGDFHGGDGMRASRTTIDNATTLRADATRTGDGGSVVVWSDQVTRFGGTISATGGPLGGNGGSAEVSGKEVLLYRGFTDLRAAYGSRGSLLLDPKNIVIATGGADPIAGNSAFADAPADTRTFAPSDIVAALDGANLTLQANNDITISDAVDASGNAGVGDLTLQAGRSIAIDADVTLRGSFSATANDTDASLVTAQRDSGPATLAMAPGTTIDTSATGGDISLRVLAGGATDKSASTMSIGSLDAGAGHVFVRYAGPTASQGIQRADGSSLITASSAAFASNGAGGAGFVGTSAAPMRLSVDNLDAVSQRNGAFFTNDKSLTIGGAALGGLTGVSVVSSVTSGDASIVADGALTVSEAVSVARNLTLSATDGISLGANVAANTNLVGASSVITDSDGDNSTSATPDPLDIADGFTLSSSGSPLTVTVGDLDLNATGRIDAGVGDLVILGSAASDTIGVGSGLVGDEVGISVAELANLTASDLTIGNASATLLRVGGVAATDLPGIGGTTNLVATDITFQSVAEFPSLSARATDSVSVLADLSTSIGTLLLQGDSDAGGAGSNDVTLAADIALYSVGDLHVLASGGIQLSGGAGTQNTFTGATLTLADIASAAADVRVQSGGNIDAGDIGIGTGELSIEIDTGDIGTFQADVDNVAASIVAVSAGSTDAIRFNGTVTTTAAAGVDIDAGTVEFLGAVNAGGSGIVRVTNVGGLIIADGAPIFAGGGFTQDGSGSVLLGDDISTSGDAVSFARPVILSNTPTDLVTIDTTIGSPAGANITFGSTTNGTSVQTQSLTLNAGTGGDILFNTGVGAIVRLNVLTITNARDARANLSVQTVRLHQIAGQRLTTFNGAVVAITGGIDLNGNEFVFGNTINAASGSPFTITNAGPLTFSTASTITATGGFVQDGAGAVTLGANLTTTGDAVTFTGPVTLRDSASDLFIINTTSGPAPLGNTVRFLSTVDGAGVGVQSLTINAGTSGDVLFDQAAGGGVRLGTLTVTNARDVIALSTVDANAVLQTAGQRLTRFDGAVTATDAAGIDLSTVTLTFNSTATASAGAGLVRARATTLTFNDAVAAGSGGIDAAADSVTFASSASAPTGPVIAEGDTIVFTGAVSAGAGGITATGGDVTFGSTASTPSGAVNVSGDSILFTGLVTAGAGGITASGADVTFGDAASSPLGPVDVEGDTVLFTGAVTAGAGGITASGGDITFGAAASAPSGPVSVTGDTLVFTGPVSAGAGGITASGAGITFSSTASTPSGAIVVDGSAVSFGGALTAGAGGVDVDAATISIGDDVTTSSGGRVDLTNTGLLTIAQGAPILADGGFSQVGAGAVSLGANITTTGDSVSFAGPVTLADTAADLVSLDTTSGANPAGASVTFGSTLTGTVASTQALTINAGTSGDAVFSGAVGATQLGVLTITNARDLIALSSLAANSVNQAAGQRATRFDGPLSTSAAGGINLTGQTMTFGDTVAAGSTGIVLNGTATSFAGGVTSGAAGIAINGTSISFADVVTAGTGGIDLNGTAVTFGNDTTVTGTGSVTVTNSGILTIADGAPIVAPGGFVQDGTGPVSLGANITTSGGAISLLRAVTLLDSGSDLVTLSTTSGGAGAGANVAFGSTLNAAAAGAQSLTIDAGTAGDATFAGAVGSTRLGTLAITNARDVLASGAVSVAAFNQAAGQRLTRFSGPVSANAAGGVSITGATITFDDTLGTGTGPIALSGGAITLSSSVTGASLNATGAALLFSGPLTIGSGGIDLNGTTVTLNDDVSSAGALTITNTAALTIPSGAPVLATGAFTQDGVGTASIGSAVTASSISFTGATTLAAPITLTGAGGVAFGSTLGVGGNNLVIVSDSAVSFAAPVTGGGATLLIEPSSNTGPIDLGTIAGGSLPGTLTLSAASASRLDGFASITIGRDPSGAAHAIRIGTSTFNDPLFIRSGSTGSILVTGSGLAGAGDATILLTGPTTLSAGISNPGRDITIDGGTTIGQSASVAISTGAGAGDILLTGDVQGTAGAGAESLTLTAGTGTIEVQGDVSGLAGAADPLGLANLTLGGASGVDLQSVSVSGLLSTSSPLTGPFVAAGPVSVGSIDVDGTTFTFLGGLFATGAVSINNSGLLTLLGGLTTDGLIEITGPALLSGTFDSTSNPITLGGAVTLADASTFNAGASTFTLGPSASIATAGHDLTLTADSMTIAAAADAISSAGAGGDLLIQPFTATRGISLASPSVDPSTAFLALSTAEVAAIDGGFDSLTVGRADGRHEVRVGSLAVADPFTLRTPVGGSIFVGNGGISGSDNASVLLDGSGATTTLSAGITTAGDDITISDAVLIGADVTLDTGAGTPGDIRITGPIDQVSSAAPGTFSLTTSAGLGDVQLDGAVGAARALESLSASGAAITLDDVGSTGAAGLADTLTLDASGVLTLAGDIYRAGSVAMSGAGVTVSRPLTSVQSDSGAVAFAGPVTLASDADLSVNAATSVAFDSTINATSGGASESLGISAGTTATLSGAVGDTAPLHSFSLDAASASLGPVTTLTTQSISTDTGLTLASDLTSTTSGSIEIGGPVTLTSDLEIRTAGAVGDDIGIDGTIDGAHAFTLNAGDGDLQLTSPIGATVALDSLTASAASILIDAIGAAGPGVSGLTSIVGSTSITFTGSTYRANGQTYSAPTKSFTSGDVRFFSSADPIAIVGGATSLASGPTFAVASSGGSITLDSLSGAMGSKAVSLDAGTGTLSLAGLTPTGSSGATLVFTADEIDLTGAVRGSSLVLQPSTPTLGITIAAGASGPALNLTIAEIAFLQDGFSSITIGREDNGAHAFTIGAITFRDPVRILSAFGGSIAINGNLTGTGDSSVYIDGPDATTTLNADITTSGTDITIDDNVLVGADATISTQGSSPTPLGGDIVITGTTDGPGGLTLDAGLGDISLTGAVGAGTRLSFLDASAQAITLPGALTTSFQRYAGATVATGATPTFATLGGSGAGISFLGDLDTGGALTASAGGALTFAGNVGATTRPASLSATGSTIRFAGSQVRTVGSQDFNGAALTFDAGTGFPSLLTFATGGGASTSIDFSSTFSGPGAIRLNAGAGTVVMGGAFGSATPLTSLDVTASAITTAGATTTGDQIFRAPVALGAASNTFSGANIRFASTLNGERDVVLRSPGEIRFEGDVGNINRVNSIDAEAASIFLSNTRTELGQRFVGNVTLNPAGVLLNARADSGAHITLGTVDGDAGLEIIGGLGSDVTILGPVGATVPLSTFAITTARNIVTQAVSADRILMDNFGDATVNGLLLAAQDGISLDGINIDLLGGMTALNNAPITIENSGLLRIPSGTQVSLSGPFFQGGAGPVQLGANIVTPSRNITFTGPVSLTSDVEIRGNVVTLGNTVNSLGAPRSLTLASAGAINLRGLGNTSPLANLSVLNAGSASATLNGNVGATGSVLIEPPLQLVSDTSITGLGGIRFGSTIDAASAIPVGLTLQVQTASSLLPADSATIPIIEFGGDVGATNPLASLRFNPVERDGVPEIATIVSRSGITFNAGTLFQVSRNDKLTAIGDISIFADRVLVGDMSAFGDIFVESPDITILSRAGANILGPQSVGTDQGVDLVALDQIQFSSTPEVDGDGLVFLATQGGAGFSATLNAFPQRAFGSITSDLYFRGSTILDLRAQGPTNTNVSESIAGASPRESQSGNVRRGTSIGAAQEDELRKIGVDPKGLDLATLIESLIGRSLYDDLPGSSGSSSRTFVTEGRLTQSIVASTLRTAVEVLGEADSDRRRELKANIAAAAEAYMAREDTAQVEDGLAFRAFIDSSDELAGARGELSGLARLFAQLRLLGLTEFELGQAWRVISDDIRPDGVSSEVLRAVVEPGYRPRPRRRGIFDTADLPDVPTVVPEGQPVQPPARDPEGEPASEPVIGILPQRTESAPVGRSR